MKRIISVFLLAIMLFAISSSCAFAEDMSVEETLLSDVWMFTSESEGYIQFYPDGSGSASGTFFEWTITDFGIKMVYTLMGQQRIAVYMLEEIDGIPTLVLSTNEDTKLVRSSDLDSAEDTDTAAEDNGMADDVAGEDNTASTEETVREVVVFANDYPMLGVGSRGDEVKAVQEALIEQGFLQGSADGIYGNGTASSVRAFQESVGLQATGTADAETQRALFGDEEEEIITITLTGTAQTEYMQIDGLFADNSYTSSTGEENLALLYVFYTVSTNDANLRISANNTTLTINGTNEYASEHTKDAGAYMESYYYRNYIEDVYIGESLKVMETFVVPKGDLAAGRTLEFSKSAIPDIDKISLMTDNVIFCDSAEEIARIIDPEGYASASYKFADADEETQQRVRNAINGYYWTFFVNNISYRIEFFSGDRFELTHSFGETSGSYTIKNGYISTVNSVGAIVNIPYSWGENDIELDVTAAWDYNEY